MSLIACRTLHGKTKHVPREQLVQRPSVYGLITHNGQAVLLKTRFADGYCLPGGGIEKGEAINDALKREVREETGIEIEVGAFAHFETDLFYYDPLDLAIHGFLFFYYCTPRTFDFCPDDQVQDFDVTHPCWVDMTSLRADAFQAHGQIILRLLREAAP